MMWNHKFFHRSSAVITVTLLSENQVSFNSPFLLYNKAPQCGNPHNIISPYVCCISAYILECRLKSFPRIKLEFRAKLSINPPTAQATETFNVATEFNHFFDRAEEYGLINSILSLRVKELKAEDAPIPFSPIYFSR